MLFLKEFRVETNYRTDAKTTKYEVQFPAEKENRLFVNGNCNQADPSLSSDLVGGQGTTQGTQGHLPPPVGQISGLYPGSGTQLPPLLMGLTLDGGLQAEHCRCCRTVRRPSWQRRMPP